MWRKLGSLDVGSCWTSPNTKRGSVIRIEAKDASTGAPLCDPIVSGSTGAGGSGSECVPYQCGCNLPVPVTDGPGRSVSYSLTISHAGYTPVSVSGVSALGFDGCHVTQGPPVVVALSPK